MNIPDGGVPQKTRTAGWLDRPAEALNVILLAFLMMQTRKVGRTKMSAPDSSDEIWESRTPSQACSYLLAPVPVVAVAGACAGFFAAGAGGFVVAGTGCLSAVLVTPAAAVG